MRCVKFTLGLQLLWCAAAFAGTDGEQRRRGLRRSEHFIYTSDPYRSSSYPNRGNHPVFNVAGKALATPQESQDQNERATRLSWRAPYWQFFNYTQVNPGLPEIKFATPGGKLDLPPGDPVSSGFLGNVQVLSEIALVSGQLGVVGTIFARELAPKLLEACGKLDPTLRCFNSLADFDRLYDALPEDKRPGLKGFFKSDEAFANERLTTSPMFIKVVKRVQDSPIDPKEITGLSEIIKDTGMSFAELVAARRVFVVDLAEYSPYLDPAVNSFVETPVGLFFIDGKASGGGAHSSSTQSSDGLQLMPLAIKYTRLSSLTLSPKDNPLDWYLAKSIFATIDSVVLSIFHFVLYHLSIVNVLIASNKYLASEHPLYPLIQQATRNDNGMVYLGFQNLLTPGTGVYDILGPVSVDSVNNKLLPYLTSVYGWEKYYFRNDLKERGVGDIPGYLYRDDAGEVYDAIYRFTVDYLKVFYKDEADIKGDYELQGFLGALYNGPAPAALPGFPRPSSVRSVEDLARILTQLLWLASTAHQVTNTDSTASFGLVQPLHNGKIWTAPPKTKGTIADEKALINTYILPPSGATIGTSGFEADPISGEMHVQDDGSASALNYFVQLRGFAFTFYPLIQAPDRLTNSYALYDSRVDHARVAFNKRLNEISDRINRREEAAAGKRPKFVLADPRRLPYWSYI